MGANSSTAKRRTGSDETEVADARDNMELQPLSAGSTPPPEEDGVAEGGGHRHHSHILRITHDSKAHVVLEDDDEGGSPPHGGVHSHRDISIMEIRPKAPDMWARENIGLYTHFAAVGLMGGMGGVSRPFCEYVFTDAPANLAANANSIIFLAWSLKLLFAIGTDSFKPFGMRRKPYMLAGWALILVLLLAIGVGADKLTAHSWILLSMLIQFCVMLADVPADGYCVELGQLEEVEKKGQILATGQFIRFMTCVLAGAIQSFLLNGPATSAPQCEVSWQGCWSWGLTMRSYYFLNFAICAVLVVPMLWMTEVEDHSPHRTFKEFMGDIFDTARNLTTSYLLVFVVGNGMLGISPFNVTTNLQYLVIGIPNLLTGIDSMSTYLALSGGIWIFQKFLINKNWRTISYCSGLFTMTLNLLWLLPFYSVGGTRNGWFTIFVDLDQAFTSGLSQVLFSMTVIELAKPGQEATVYELLISVSNACMMVSSILATQLLSPLGASACSDKNGQCPADTIDNKHFDESNGPWKSTKYLLVVTAFSMTACLIFTRFLPTQKAMCAEWKRRGEASGGSNLRATLTLLTALFIVAYGITGTILLMIPSTACMKAIGGPGC